MGKLIAGIAVDDDAITITYLSLPEDLRENGLAATHQIAVPMGEDYRDEIDALLDAAQALLEDALEDFATVGVFVPPDPDDTDEDEED